MNDRIRDALYVVLIVLVVCSSVVAGADDLRPPCGVAPLPMYADIPAPPNIGVWKAGVSGSRWEPPACMGGWGSGRFDLMVAVAGRFRGEDSTETVLARFGEVSRFAGVRYWSVSK